MKSLFKLITCLYSCTWVIANAPTKAPELSKDLKEDWAQFFSQPIQNGGPTTRADVSQRDQIDNYFLHPLPGYEAFNKWFYKALDNGSKSIYEQIRKSYEDPNFVPQETLINPPFPIPAQFERVYSWLLTQNPSLAESAQRERAKIDEHKKKVNAFFGNTIKPVFENFYQWLYGKQEGNSDWKQQLEDTKKLSSPRFKAMSGTPFPVPKKYHLYYYYEMMHPNRTITRHNYSVTSNNSEEIVNKLVASPQQLQKNQPIDKDLVNDFFGGTVDPVFGDFYDWFYEKQHEDDNWQKELDIAKDLNTSGFDLAATPFPIPEKYHPFYMFANILSPPENTSDPNQKTFATDLDKLLDEANKLVNYQEFNDWLNEASPFQKNLLKKACEFTLQPLKVSNMSTPFPVPQPLRDAFCWAVFHDDVDNTTSNPADIYYRNELEKFFKKSHLPIHDLFYQWLHDVETDEERAKARQATDQPIKLDFAKWMRFTPFPVPAEHLHHFAYINAIESLLNISSKSPTKGGSEAGTSIPGTKSYLEFTQWVNKVLNNDQQLLADKIKECQHDMKFNLREISTTTPFPVPLNHFRFYHWLNAHLDDLKKSTPSQSISPQPGGSDSGANKYPEFVQWLNKIFNYDQAEIARQNRECQADHTFQPKNIPVTAPFAVPLHYYRFYHWVNSKLHPEDYVTHEPPSSPKPFVFEQKTNEAETTSNLQTKSYHDFTAWLNSVFNNDPELIEHKMVECRHDQNFRYKSIADHTTPFPIPVNNFRFFHWVLERMKDGKLGESVPIQTHPNPPSTHARGKIKSYPEFDYWLNRIFKNDPELLEEKVEECQHDKDFNLKNKDPTPFPIPIRYYRFYYWLTDKLKSGALSTSANDPYKPPPTQPESEEYDEDEFRPPTTPSYQKFTNWLNEILDHKQEVINQKIKECQHDREFNPRDIKEPLPFPVPLRYFRFYHWLKAKVEAGKHKQAGVIHTSPPKRYGTTGKPGVSFMSTQAFPEYTQWLFNQFKNDQKQIKEKINECQHDPSFNPRAIKVSTPFPIPIRHYRFYHWINSKLNPDAYTFSPDKITHPTPPNLDDTYPPLTREVEVTTKVTETTTDLPPPSTKSYLEFTKWLNNVLDDNAELIEHKMKECQHDQEFNPRDIKEPTPFPVPINHFRFYHWLNAKQKAGEHKKQGIIHTSPPKRYGTTGKPGVSFMTTQAFPEYTQWLFNHFKNDQKQIKAKINECQQDKSFSPREINATTPFPIPIRHFRFYHWMNSKLQSQKPSA